MKACGFVGAVSLGSLTGFGDFTLEQPLLVGNKLKHSLMLLADVLLGCIQGLFHCCQINP